MSASIDTDFITFEVVVPNNTWFGLGFGANMTRTMNNTDIIFFDGHSTSDADGKNCKPTPATSLFATTTKLPDEDKTVVITKQDSTCEKNATTYKVKRALKGVSDKITTLEKNKNYTFVYAINTKGEVGK